MRRVARYAPVAWLVPRANQAVRICAMTTKDARALVCTCTPAEGARRATPPPHTHTCTRTLAHAHPRARAHTHTHTRARTHTCTRAKTRAPTTRAAHGGRCLLYRLLGFSLGAFLAPFPLSALWVVGALLALAPPFSALLAGRFALGFLFLFGPAHTQRERSWVRVRRPQPCRQRTGGTEARCVVRRCLDHRRAVVLAGGGPLCTPTAKDARARARLAARRKGATRRRVAPMLGDVGGLNLRRGAVAGGVFSGAVGTRARLGVPLQLGGRLSGLAHDGEQAFASGLLRRFVRAAWRGWTVVREPAADTGASRAASPCALRAC